jgi:hypothetical protein
MASERTTGAFEKALSQVQDGTFKQALVNVLDTADMCRRWLGAARLDPSTPHVVALTRLVMDEAARLRAPRRAADESGA